MFSFGGMLEPCSGKKELYTINKQKIHLEFTTENQFDDLNDVKLALEKLDITIIYTSLQFDEEGF